MLLSPTSIEQLASVVIGYSSSTYKITKNDFDNILQIAGLKKLVCSYDECFNKLSNINEHPLFSSKAFKLEKYAQCQLQKINGTADIHKFIVSYFSDISNYTSEPEEVVDYLNRYIDKDGYSIEKIKETDEYKIYSIDDCLVNYDCLFKETERGNYILINEHNKKWFNKIKTGDLTGAITNSRSLLEQLLCEIKNEIQSQRGERISGYNGEITPLVNKVFSMLDFEDGLTGAPMNAYENIEEGFKNLIKGLAILRIGMSDAHSITYRPTLKDAILAANTAKTIANFIVKHYFEKFGDIA